MPAPGLFPILTPGKFPDHADDAALMWAARFRGEAAGELTWALHCMGDDSMAGAVRATLARALRMAAAEMEAASCSTPSGTTHSTMEG